MLGLIKKDIYMLKNNLKIILLIAVVYLVMAKGDIGQIAFLMSFISIMFSMSSFSYDAYNHWDTYACALPKGRKNIVISKYVSGTLMVLISSIMTLILGLIMNALTRAIILKDLLTTILISLYIVIIIVSLIYPFIFKYGIEKGRYILFIGSFLIAGISAFAMKANNGILTKVASVFDNYWLILLPIIVIVMLILSILISLHIYKNKEF